MIRGGRTIAAAVGALMAIVLTAGTVEASPRPEARASAPALTGPVEAKGPGVDIATGLAVPWSILRLNDANDTVLVSERDTGVIQRITSTGALDPLATIPGVHHTAGGEGGLLGLATLVDGGTRWIYAYFSTTTDNRIVRMVYTDPGDPADATLGPAQVILSGLQVGTSHNGGRIAFGPDGMLYASVGDTNRRDTPQSKTSLNGKILRMTPTGGVPSDNPFPSSLIYSLGHRNPQGLAWDSDGQLWESELGWHHWDEFNKIVPGGNYGWPIVEGRSSDKRFINPWVQWHTSDASPSGLTYVDGTFFMASLRGSRVWTIYVDKAAGTARALPAFTNTYGRIRDVVPGPADTLWILTNNTARGTPRPGDDRIVQVALVESGTVDATIDCASCPLAGAVRLSVTLQKKSGTTWSTSQTTTSGGGPVELTGVWAGTYRLVVRDIGADGYLTYTGTAFTVATSQVVDQGTIRLRGSQLDRDLTGDGRPDLLAVTAAGDLVRYDGATGGGLDAVATVATGWAATAIHTAQAGDFDGDGTADVVSRSADGALWLHPGDGAGALLPAVQLSPPATGQTLLLGPGDWNGDGRPDLVTADTAGRLWLRAGNGQSPLGAPKQIGHGWNGLTVVPAGDITGDLRPDIVARTSSGDVRIYPGNGTGGFLPAIRIAHGWSIFTALAGAGDLSGDGRGDLIARAPDGSLRLYRGLVKRVASPPTVIAGDWSTVTFTP